MSDIRFNRWLHNSGTGGVFQDSAGNVGIGSSVPQTTLDLGSGNITSHNINSTGIITATGFSGNVTGTVNSTGIITATSFSGSGSGLTGIVNSGITTVAAGTAAAPSISPTGDSNTGIFFPSPDTVAIAEGGAEAMRVDSSGRLLIGISTSANANGGILQLTSGITFPATAVAASDANTLDDYEEGTFTPTLSSGFSSGPTSYAYQVGRYTRIGRLVHFQIDIQPTGATADASYWKLAGLPFIVSTTPGGAYIVYQASSNTNALDVFLANTGEATIDIFTSAGAPRSGNAAGVNINARLIIVGSYIA